MSEAKYMHEWEDGEQLELLLIVRGFSKRGARLLAAAPDLYDALKDCVEALEHIESIGMKVNPPTLANAKAAIKKATP